MPDTLPEDSFARLVKIRGSVKSRHTIIKNHVAGLVEDAPLSPDILDGLQSRLSKLTDIYAEFLAAQLEIDLTFDDVPATQFEIREAFENAYFELDSKIRSLLAKNHVSVGGCSIRNPNSSGAQIKLPEIKLPRFDGRPEGWLEFRDLYESLVSLIGAEAALVIASLEFSNRAYIEAWRLLCDRYNNPNILIHSHVKAIFSFESMHKESATQIRSMLDNLAKHLAALKILKEPTEKWDTLLIFMITTKLDSTTSREWEEYQLEQRSAVELKTLIKFLSNKATVNESIQLKRADKPSNTNNYNRYRSNAQPSSRAFATTQSYSHTCSHCKGPHSLTQCTSFVNLNVGDRINHAKSHRLCLNCLRPGHLLAQCRSGTCRKCGRKHNTLLHIEFRPSTPVPQVTAHIEAGTQGVEDSITTAACQSRLGHTLLATAIVYIFDTVGERHKLRALLDSGSQSSFVTSDVIAKLGLSCTPTNINVYGFKESKSQIKHKCSMKLQSCHSDYSIEKTFLVTAAITCNLPTFSFDKAAFKIPPNCTLADPDFHISQRIDLLLGSDCFWDLLLVGHHNLGKNLPSIRNTKFGWIVAGPMMLLHLNDVKCHLSRISLDDQLIKFWQLEEFTPQTHYSSEEEECERYFAGTTRRNSTGRFVVKLPLKNIHELGDSYEIASRRFVNLEQKLHRNTSLYSQYSAFIHEYIALGHMVKITDTDRLNLRPSYYLPHHAVYNLNSSTTKIRVVFDASCKTSTGRSLNDCQLVGPVLQNDLFSILLRFRKYAYVLTADVAKMYRQVLVEPSQHALQRILWRFKPTDNLGTYELQTVTYGMASASYLAIKCLQQLADDHRKTHPIVSRVLAQDFYVDDVLTGADSLEQLLEIRHNLDKILSTACFNLHKWRSNHCNFAADAKLPPQSHSLKFEPEEHSTKTLGLLWNSLYDQFSFDTQLASYRGVNTKRTVLSRIAQIFDPLGLIAPCTIIGKILMQRLWLETITWDDPLPLASHVEWSKYSASLTHLNKVCIPRYVFTNSNCSNVQLHGFCDSSASAYGACLYVRATSPEGLVSCHLLCAKTRVSPLKTVTIPRLELCAAVETNEKAWVKTPPFKLATFVGNRIAEIQAFTSVTAWRHVPTKSNPADLLSRGVNPLEIANCSLWWTGPDWLTESSNFWPNSLSPPIDTVLPETRKTFTHTLLSLGTDPVICFENYSSFDKLCRIVAYIFRFVSATRRCSRFKHIHITLPEANAAELVVVRLVQEQTFAKEIKLLKASKPLSLTSAIFRLNPFLDTQSILRVGGRLNNTNYSFDQKHPLLLPKHHVTRLIFLREHHRLLHIAPLGLLNSMRQRFWPISGRSVARQIVHKCTTCFRVNPRPFPPPLMAQLPNSRVSASFPFAHCGVDYAGPVELKATAIRNAKTCKACIALFVCMSTKAVHLELITSLTTDAFIAMLRRFCSRRGVPTHMYSDNATNFVGAHREISKFFKQYSNQIESDCARQKIQWHFIPPRSPNFGGLWEAGVKSTKHHLKRVIGEQTLTFENFATLLTQVEAVLNSRPISPLSMDPNDCSPLTPGHFLIGRPITAILDQDVIEIPCNRLSKFQLLQSLAQAFWKRWQRDYLNTMQQRSRWTKHNGTKPRIGQLVILKDDNAPILKWTTGRITELHQGRDAITRVVSVKTTKGTYTRAITKLCPLPIDIDDDIDEDVIVGQDHEDDATAAE